jgi:phage tail sheath protein FI
MPPEGALTGILALRALERGAWIAPANEQLRGVLVLTPRLARDAFLDLQDAHINILRQEPRGFLTLSADTLSEGADLVPMGVRRLMILLRRLALREGTTYVFEPNDESFRQLVKRSFETALGQLFVRGAFAGSTPSTSFQVLTGEPPNTKATSDRGQLIVELRVAPSLPMTFLSVRLVQSGDSRLMAQES